MPIDAGTLVLGAIERKNKQWPQWLTVFSATLCLFNAGICFTWSSPSLVILQGPDTPFNITNSEASWIASLMPFGSALGPIIGALSTRYMGPKQSIIMSSIPFLVGYILIIVASNPWYLYISRFISGIGVGFGFSSVPIYISEIAESHNRGALTLMMVMMLGFGSSLPITIGPYIGIQLMAIISCIFPTLLLTSMLFMPDSPYYLMRIGKEDEAKSTLKWLRRQTEDSAIRSEFSEIKKVTENNYGILDCIKEMRNRPNPKALFLVFITILAQQFSGVMAVTFYQEQIYIASEVPISPYMAVIMSQVIGSVFGICTVFLVDRWGRKPLLTMSIIGCCISTAMIGLYYQISYMAVDYPFIKWLPVVGTNGMMVAFAVGLGPIPYTILAEVFTSSVKEIATCSISVAGALTSFAVTKLFQVIDDAFGSAVVFYSLSLISFVLLVAIVIFLPETMNKSLLDIQNLLMGGSESKLSKASNKKKSIENP